MADQILDIRTAEIVPGDNDRQRFSQRALEELACSIKENGLAQPITVRPLQDAEDRRYQIVAGERRFRAIRDILGWPEAPCLVRTLSDEEASAIMLTENTNRQDLDPMEEAHAYQKRIEQFGWSIEKVASVAGVTERQVARRLSLLQLADDIQDMVAKGQLDVTKAELIATLDHNRQHIALRIFTPDMAKETLVAIVSDLLQQQSQEELFDAENFWVEQVVEKGRAAYGRNALVIAPTLDHLPPIEVDRKRMKTGAILYSWMVALCEKGFRHEAAVVGTLYKRMVETSFIAIPPEVLAMTEEQQKQVLGL